jgi:hypothetical protein
MKPSTGRLFVVIALAAIVAAGCRQFLPDTHTTSISPNGNHTAFVRQYFNIDPSDDHLFLSTRGGPARRLMDLPADADWCKTIVWTPDSRKIGFVINDEKLAIFDAETAALEAFVYLVGNGCCGGPQEAKAVTINSDLTEVSFERFDRPTVLIRRKDGEQFEAPVTSEAPELVTNKRPIHKPAKSYGREILHIPASRGRLRLVTDSGRPASATVFVRLVSKKREIGLVATSGTGGLLMLPAFVDGALDRLEVGHLHQPRDRQIFTHVNTGGDPILVTIPPLRP